MDVYSAGVLPYSIHNGRVVWLLGRDTHRNVWSDFGGHCEFRDKNDPINTASREFYEETLGSIMTIRHMKHEIEDSSTTAIQSKTMLGNKYTMYLIQIPYNPIYRTTFGKTRQYMNYLKCFNRFVEKNDIRWFDHSKLFKVDPPIRYRMCFYNTITNNKEVMDGILKRLTGFD